MDLCRQFRPQGECEKGSPNRTIGTRPAADLMEPGMFLPALSFRPSGPPEFTGIRR